MGLGAGLLNVLSMLRKLALHLLTTFPRDTLSIRIKQAHLAVFFKLPMGFVRIELAKGALKLLAERERVVHAVVARRTGLGAWALGRLDEIVVVRLEPDLDLARETTSNRSDGRV